MPGREEARWLGRGKGNVKPVQRKREPVPPRLQIGLLPCPAGKERLATNFRRECKQGSAFAWRKVPGCNLGVRHVLLDALDIDPEHAVNGSRDQDYVARVGDIELDRAVRVSQSRLSKCIVFEFNLMRRSAEVVPEEQS